MALDQYIRRPDDMVSYLSNNAWHFNKKSCMFAVSKMKRKNPATNKLERIDPFTKEQTEELLTKNGIMLENNKGWDFVYVANMAKADLHPKYQECKVTCNCGNTFTVGSTKPEIHVEICSKCHSFYTGQQKALKARGRIDKFNKKYGIKED